MNGRRKRIPTGSAATAALLGSGNGRVPGISAPMMATVSSNQGKKRRLEDEADPSRRTPKGKDKDKVTSLLDKDRDSESVKDSRDRQKLKKPYVCLRFWVGVVPELTAEDPLSIFSSS